MMMPVTSTNAATNGADDVAGSNFIRFKNKYNFTSVQNKSCCKTAATFKYFSYAFV